MSLKWRLWFSFSSLCQILHFYQVLAINRPEIEHPLDKPLLAGKGSIPWWAWLLVTLLGSVIIYFIVYVACCDSESGEEVLCYLCNKNIGGFHWQNGAHRRICAEKNVIFLNSLPTRSNCPKCGESLRQWPIKLSAQFVCDGVVGCPYNGTFLSNTGRNRFNCFQCNFDLCQICVVRRVHEENRFVVNFNPCNDEYRHSERLSNGQQTIL